MCFRGGTHQQRCFPVSKPWKLGRKLEAWKISLYKPLGKGAWAAARGILPVACCVKVHPPPSTPARRHSQLASLLPGAILNSSQTPFNTAKNQFNQQRENRSGEMRVRECGLKRKQSKREGPWCSSPPCITFTLMMMCSSPPCVTTLPS